MTQTQTTRLATARRLGPSGDGRAIRTRARLSLRDVAREVGVDAATIQRWETGASTPRADAALRWEAVLARLDRMAGK